MPKVKRRGRKFMLTRRSNKKKEEIEETGPTTSSTKPKKRISFEPEAANISNFFLGGEDGKEQTYKVHWKDFPLRSPTDVYAHQISAVMIYLFWWKTFTEFNEFEEIAKRRPLTAKEQETEAEHARSIQNYKKLIEMGEEFSAGYGDLTYPLKVYRHRLNTGHPNPFDNDYHPGDPEKSDVSSDEDFNPSDSKPHRNVKFSAEQKARRIEKIRKKKEKDIERFGREVDEVEVEDMIYRDEREVIQGYHGTREDEEHEEKITEHRDEEDGVLEDVEDFQEDFGDFAGEDVIKVAIEDVVEDAGKDVEEEVDVDISVQGVLMSEKLEDIYKSDHNYFK